MFPINWKHSSRSALTTKSNFHLSACAQRKKPSDSRTENTCNKVLTTSKGESRPFARPTRDELETEKRISSAPRRRVTKMRFFLEARQVDLEDDEDT